MEKFCLKWDHFQDNISKSFRNLRKEKDFFDVTLISEDDEVVLAHKVVLSASSEMFKYILRRADHSKPMVYLTGVKSSQLGCIMDYIYEGEVSIYQHDLENFIDIAKKLKIKGLLNCDLQNEDYYPQEENKMEGDSPNKKTESFKDPGQIKKIEQEGKNQFTIDNHNLSTIYEDAKRAVDELVMKVGDVWMCKTCEKTMKKNCHIRKHAELHIEGLSFPCNSCRETFRTRKKLAQHKYVMSCQNNYFSSI